jgi:hypothetical protein
MLRLLILVALALASSVRNSVAQDTDWAWFRAVSTGTSWWMTEGHGRVTSGEGKFEARLYDKTDPKFLRLTVWGATSKGITRVRVRVEESDSDEFELSGRLRRSCWAKGGGRETLLLSNDTEVIGLVRELVKDRPCKPT